MAEEDERVEPRRSARLALTEISFNESLNEETPNKNVSADELVIIQRGPRRKPIIWSPVELDRSSARKSKEQGSMDSVPRRPSLNPKLRRRLILSPTKGSGEISGAIVKKLRSLPMFSQELLQKTP